MTEAELVNQITAQVIAMLKQQGATTATSPAAPVAPKAAPAAFASKTNPLIAKPGGKTAKAPAAPPAPKRLFVTADMLAERIAGGGPLELAHNEYLTPNAQDLAEKKHLSLRRADKPAPSAAMPKTGETPTAAAPVDTRNAVGLVIDRPDEKVRAVVSALDYENFAVVDCNQVECPLENLTSLARAVGEGRLASGVAILPYAAEALILANKVRGVRAVQGTRVESVKAGVRRAGANLLVLEHALCTFNELRAMIRAFVTARSAAGAGGAIAEAIAKLET